MGRGALSASLGDHTLNAVSAAQSAVQWWRLRTRCRSLTRQPIHSALTCPLNMSHIYCREQFLIFKQRRRRRRVCEAPVYRTNSRWRLSLSLPEDTTAPAPVSESLSILQWMILSDNIGTGSPKFATQLWNAQASVLADSGDHCLLPCRRRLVGIVCTGGLLLNSSGFSGAHRGIWYPPANVTGLCLPWRRVTAGRRLADRWCHGSRPCGSREIKLNIQDHTASENSSVVAGRQGGPVHARCRVAANLTGTGVGRRCWHGQAVIQPATARATGVSWAARAQLSATAECAGVQFAATERPAPRTLRRVDQWRRRVKRQTLTPDFVSRF